MYFNVFSLFNYKQEVNNNLIIYNDNVDCFICFMPSKQNNQINMLSEFSHIIPKCKCNAKIHLLCLNIWIKQTQSCPICRTKFISIKDLQKHNLQKYYLVCIINIYLFIIFICNIHLFIYLFIYLLYQIYLIKL